MPAGVRGPEPHPERQARYAVLVAIRTGTLIRPETCSRCGVQCRPDAHHEDYSKPLEVEWLCRRCHLAEHRCTGSRLPNKKRPNQ